jgi:hypothetical protein
VRGARLGFLFVAVIALIWAALLVPSMLRNRLEPSPINGVRDFERSMGVLANTRNRKATTPGRWIMVPRHDVTESAAVSGRRRTRVVRRRRQNFERLLAAAAITLLLGFLPHLHWIWFVHLAVDAGLGFYVSRLLAYKRLELERRHVATEATAPEEPTTQEPRSEDPVRHASSL